MTPSLISTIVKIESFESQILSEEMGTKTATNATKWIDVFLPF